MVDRSSAGWHLRALTCQPLDDTHANATHRTRALPARTIFEADTRAGRTLDIALILAIVARIFLVVLERVTERGTPLGRALFVAQWILPGLFTLDGNVASGYVVG